MSDPFTTVAATTCLVAPALLLASTGLPPLFGKPLSETTIARFTATSGVLGLLASLFVLGSMLVTGSRLVAVELGDWVAIPEEHFHFHLKFVFDRLSVPFVILTFTLVGTVGAFANRYLHREPGYARFFVLYAVFQLGMVTALLAGTIETLFFGWELVGLSSALLVAYFHERPGPVDNGLRVWTVYRFADAAFLIAALTLHHLSGEGDFVGMMGTDPWPAGTTILTTGQATFVGLLLLVAAAGKSGLVPFSGWLPRAMEGPTPSSAVFYGALSVNLGAYLLLRMSPLIEVSLPLQIAVISIGLATAWLAAIAVRVQSDVKSMLAFASLTQIGIITVEIGFGFTYLAIIHMIGHACFRTLQLLRAPSVLHDYHALENALGRHVHEAQPTATATRWSWLYRMAYRRGYLDAVLNRCIVSPFLSTFRAAARLEHRITEWFDDAATPPIPASADNGQTHQEPRAVIGEKTTEEPAAEVIA